MNRVICHLTQAVLLLGWRASCGCWRKDAKWMDCLRRAAKVTWERKLTPCHLVRRRCSSSFRMGGLPPSCQRPTRPGGSPQEGGCLLPCVPTTEFRDICRGLSLAGAIPSVGFMVTNKKLGRASDATFRGAHAQALVEVHLVVESVSGMESWMSAPPARSLVPVHPKHCLWSLFLGDPSRTTSV